MSPGLEAFLAVARLGSFTRAAQALGVSKSHVSKQVRRAEDRLGVQLLRRTTRSVSLTEEGQRYLDGAGRLVDELVELERHLGRAAEPRGTLKLSMPPEIPPVAEVVTAFVTQHPHIRLVLHLTNQHVDVIGGGYDMVLRMGELDDSNLVARRVGTMRLGLYAAPAYLERAGTPRAIEATATHDWLMFSVYGTGRTERIGLDDPMQVLADAILREGRVVMDSNSLFAMRRGCAQGLGLCFLPLFMAEAWVGQGRLFRLLTGEPDLQIPIWAVSPPSRFDTLRVAALQRALIDGLPPLWSR